MVKTLLIKNVKLISVLIVGLFALLTILGAFQILGIKTNYSFRQFFPQSHPLLKQNEQVKQRFNITESAPFLLVASLKEEKLDWSHKAYLQSVSKLTEKIKEIPHIKDVKSISTLQGAVESDTGLGVGFLVNYLTPQNFKKELRKNPILSPFFISKDAKLLTIFISFDDISTTEIEKMKNKLLDLADDYLSFSEVSVGGVPAIQSDVSQILNREIIQFITVAFFMSLIALMIIFKNLAPILICTLLSLITNILSVWGISLFGFSFNILSSTIPILVTMTVVSVALHSILRLIENSEKYPDRNLSNNIIKTFIELFRPNLLTALTTSVGFFTLTLSESPIIKEFGLSVGIALLVTWINTAVLLPALLLLSPAPILRKWMGAKARWPFFIFKYYKIILVSVVSLTLLSAWKGQHLSWNAKLFDDLPENHEVRKTTELVDQSLGGLIPLEIEIRMNGGENPWSMEENVNSLSLLEKEIRDKRGVGSVVSISDLIQASGMRSNRKPAAVSEVLFLMSMSSENPLKNYLSSDSLSTRLSIRLQDIPGYKMWHLVQDIKQSVKEYFPKAKVKIAGTAAYIHDINNALSKELLYGFWQAMLVIFIMLIFTYRSIRWAILACIPNLTPPALLLGALAFWQIPIKPGIAIILSISLGLAFNNTVYLLERMRHLIEKGFSHQKSLQHTFWSEANPCFFSSLVLIVGFASFAVSYFKMNQMFGVFMVLSVLTGLLGDLVFLPALLQLILSSKFKKFNILKKAHIVLIFFGIIFSLQNSNSASLTIADLGKRMKQAVDSKDESGVILMKIIEANGDSKVREIQYSRLVDKGTHYTLMRMLSPKDIKGTSLLSTIKNGSEDKWIYLPTSKQTRKITTSDQSSRVLESELYTEDFNLNIIKSSSSKILKDGSYLVVESTLKNSKSSYSKTISTISAEGLLQKAEVFDRKNKLLKVVQFQNYKKIGTSQKYRANTILIENVQNKRKTELTFQNLKLNQNLKSQDFSLRALSEGL